jgi:nucleotide-binding universal stress UspA family protein
MQFPFQYLVFIITFVYTIHRMEYRRILVGVNDSIESARAQEEAISIASKYNSLLFAITVFDIPDIHTSSPQDNKLSSINLEEYIQKVKAMLLDLKETAEGNGVEVEIELVDERLRPEKAILDYSKKKGIDLIIIGKRKKDNMKEIILGSTALEIAKEADCNVMLVR